MSDEIKKEELDQQEEKQEVIQPEVAEEVKEEAPAIEEETKKPVEETPAEDVAEPKKEEEVPPTEEEKPAEEEKAEEPETKEEAPVEEVTEPEEEEELTEPETVKEEVDVDAIKAELEELKAEKAEAEEVEALGRENARVANEFNQLCQGLGKGLEEAFEKYSIPTDKTIEELEKEDPTKAQLAKNLTKQANDIIEAAKKDAEAFLNEKAHEVVFKKADRLLQKMDVSEEEAPIVAETFLDIIAQAGIRDLHDDLKAKLELAVAKAKMVVKAAGKTVDVVKTAADVVKEHVDKVVEKIEKVEEIITDEKDITDKKDIKDEPAKKEEEPAKAIETPVEEIDKSEFEEGVGAKSEPASLSVDNFLERLDQVKDLDKPAFIKANYSLFEAAMRKAGR